MFFCHIICLYQIFSEVIMNGQYNPNAGQAPQQPQYQAPQQPQYQQPQYQAPQQTAPAKPKLPTKMIAAIGAAVVGLIVIILIISSCGGGGYMNPINKLVEMNNKKSYGVNEFVDATANGFLAGEFKSLLKDVQKLDDYKDLENDMKENAADSYERNQDTYGKNFRYSFKKEDVDKIESDDRQSYRDSVRSKGDTIAEYIESYKKLDNSEKGDLADRFGVKKADLDKIYNDLKSISDTLKKVKVDEGYKIGGYGVITGSELDEPEESRTTLNVYKVNGTWVTSMGLSEIISEATSIARTLFD